ncbi:hypothetical protein MNBD_ALPHA03-1277 [hydrothermal vent metagenome]|uniref:Sulfotransferase domain-containing protein n=1 Tax=hydrothermal vent metagenome TaxID=652676 RepID=A0A3B1BNT3_9ZZZZ
MSFFIIGLPRSRTAWLANFMTHNGEYCHHEGMNGCRSMEEYKDKIGGDGDSNTCMMMFDLKKHFPYRKILIIESDPKKTERYIMENLDLDGADWVSKAIAQMDKLDGFRVHFDNINNRLRQIWEYLSDAPYDAKRGNMIKNLNVQSNIQDMDIKSAQYIAREVLQC